MTTKKQREVLLGWSDDINRAAANGEFSNHMRAASIFSLELAQEVEELRAHIQKWMHTKKCVCPRCTESRALVGAALQEKKGEA